MQDYEAKLKSPKWRLNNLYWIEDKEGNVVLFKMNRAQEQLLSELDFLNIILKARQLGFSTFIDILILDQCLWNSNTSAGIIADTLDNAKGLLSAKIKFPYSRLDEAIKERKPLVKSNETEVEWENGSSVKVGASLRSGTYQLLHISEYGKICAKSPDKAKEVKSGALNTLAPGCLGFIESTAEGQDGDFYEKTQAARAIAESGRKPNPLEWKFHFFAWWMDDRYEADPEGVVITKEMAEYFDKKEKEGVPPLSDRKKAWYVLKEKEQGEDMKKEYPSTPDEAFEAAIEGAYFAKQLTTLRKLKRIGSVPFDPALPVNSFWDLGMDDSMTIWLHQFDGSIHRFIGYYENSGEGMSHYINWLRDWRDTRGAVWGQHFGPHDLNVRELMAEGKTRQEVAQGLGIKFEVVPRVADKRDGIEASRQILPLCAFDEEECSTGIKHLTNYRKDFDEKNGVWKSQPRHDEASHGADAFQTFSTGWVKPVTRKKLKARPVKGIV
ncbi:terminase [uncultured Cohaesibacter sp.]|uniref:terminase n=1 Tax=uncultured Cohaesibacter sp. TaxID=1002546 RepID=UPI002AAA75FD|nr:terminase [uncultured Cohaesibacter sp.]